MEWLPLRFDVAVATRVFTRWGLRSPKGAALARNLEVVTGGPVPPRLVRRALASYGQYWAESAKLAGLSREARRRHFVIAEGLEHLLAAVASGRGVVIALPHSGSWDWGGAILVEHGITLHVVAEELEPPALFQWFLSRREHVGLKVIPLNEKAGPAILDVLSSGGAVGLLCDRDIQGGGHVTRFFGHEVSMPAGPATLALRTGAVLLGAATFSGPGRFHHAVITPPIEAQRQGRLREDVARVTLAVTEQLEQLIRRHPEQWHVLEDRFEESQ